MGVQAYNISSANGSNRTFMELKYEHGRAALAELYARSNRTFMELKLGTEMNAAN